jgi:hypothetical protein
MSKNEIHARLMPEVMEKVRELTRNRNFSTISHTVRWLIDCGLRVATDDIDLQKKNNSIVQIIEQELGVFFAECRDEYDPEDGQLYWFWFKSKNESLCHFDPDSTNNCCPAKRFKSREDAIKDCLKEKVNQSGINSLIESFLPSLSSSVEANEDNIIDW